MPHCPNCGAEYRDGCTVCTDCRIPLRDGPPPQPEPPDGALDLVELCACRSDVEAAMLQQFLSDNAIPVILHGCSEIDNLSAVYTGNTFSGKRVLVNRADHARAQELTAAFQSGGAQLLEPLATTEAVASAAEPDDAGQASGSGLLLIPLVILGILCLAAGHGLAGIALFAAAAAVKTLW